jgi:hypothetical protein
MKPLSWQNQRGAGLIIVVAMLLIVGIIGAVFVSLIGNESFTAMNQSAGLLTFGITDGGVEFEQYNLAQNVDWYHSSSDPMPSTIRTLGAAPNSGSFTVQSYLPATELRNRMNTSGILPITVYTTNRFPSAGFLQVDDDITSTSTEYVSYTGTTPTTFTGITRNVKIGTIQGTAPVAHDRGSRVYPVTTLSVTTVDPVGACPLTGSNITIATHTKFLTAGMIDIEDEEIGYTGSTVSGGTTTLLGVTRCMNGTAIAGHASGQPVTPLLWDGTSPDYLAEVVSTGTVAVTITGNAVRVIRKTVQR